LIHLSHGPRISGIFIADYSHNGWFKATSGKLESSKDTVGNDPLFVNAADADFRLNLRQPCGRQRNRRRSLVPGLAPDLGAFEVMDGVHQIQSQIV
jgi:hypothetical protein